MANWANPQLTSTYTNFVSEVKDRDVDLALQFDGTTSSSIPTGAIRWDSTANRWKKWNSSSWAELTGTYALTGLSTTGAASIGTTLNVIGQTTLATATATTPATADNNTNVATTAFVKAQGYAPLASPTFTGSVTIPSGASIAGYLTTTAAAAAYPTLTGGNASGTWGINVTGSSASCTGNAATAYSLNVHAGRNNEANKVVRTDASGYLQVGYLNSSSGDENNASNADRVWGTNGIDSYLRTYRTSSLSVNYANSSGSATTAGTCTGNAATATALSTYGTSGQVLTSQGPSVAPTWATISATPAGAVDYFAMSSAPTGYLKANGAAISRTTYSALFTAIGTTFGVGDGSTTFNVPDLRGEFIRGWDDSKGVDSGRGFGSTQADEFRSHSHNITVGLQSGEGINRVGYNQQQTRSTGSAGGTETRPRNIALLACIKF